MNPSRPSPLPPKRIHHIPGRVVAVVFLCLLPSLLLLPLVEPFPWFGDVTPEAIVQDNVAVQIDHAHHHQSFRVQRAASSELPSNLNISFLLGTEPWRISLKRNDRFWKWRGGKSGSLSAGFPVFVIQDGQIQRKQINTQNTAGLYVDESSGSSFVVRKIPGLSDFVLEGVFYKGPTRLTMTPSPSGTAHRVHAQSLVMDFRNDYIKQNGPYQPLTESPRSRLEKSNQHPLNGHSARANTLTTRPNGTPEGQREANPLGSNTSDPTTKDPFSRSRLEHGDSLTPPVEHTSHPTKRRATGIDHQVHLFMVADYRDYRTWLKFYGYNATLTQLEMNLYYAFIANSISVRYSSVTLVDPSFRLDVTITGLLIVNSNVISYWTDEHRLGPGSRYVEASGALEAFRTWVKSARFDLPPSDHWMLFTGFDIFTERNPNVAGLAKLGGMCSLSSVSVIEQDNTGSVGATAAHELGHSLNAVHDGEEKECHDEDNYVMSRKLKTPDDELLASRPWQFSPCSVRAFKRFVSQIKCPQRSRVMSALSTELSAGQIFSADLQCQLALGNASYFGRSLQIREGYPSMCRRLYCAVPGEPGLFQAIFAMEKTSCGDGKWCQRGKCVDHIEAPHMEDSCPQGNDPTAPCVREDCPYYTPRTKLVYCCSTCVNTLTAWLTLLTKRAPSAAHVVREIDTSAVQAHQPQVESTTTNSSSSSNGSNNYNAKASTRDTPVITTPAFYEGTKSATSTKTVMATATTAINTTAATAISVNRNTKNNNGLDMNQLTTKVTTTANPTATKDNVTITQATTAATATTTKNNNNNNNGNNVRNFDVITLFTTTTQSSSLTYLSSLQSSPSSLLPSSSTAVKSTAEGPPLFVPSSLSSKTPQQTPSSPKSASKSPSQSLLLPLLSPSTSSSPPPSTSSSPSLPSQQSSPLLTQPNKSKINSPTTPLPSLTPLPPKPTPPLLPLSPKSGPTSPLPSQIPPQFKTPQTPNTSSHTLPSLQPEGSSQNPTEHILNVPADTYKDKNIQKHHQPNSTLEAIVQSTTPSPLLSKLLTPSVQSLRLNTSTILELTHYTQTTHPTLIINTKTTLFPRTLLPSTQTPSNQVTRLLPNLHIQHQNKHIQSLTNTMLSPGHTQPGPTQSPEITSLPSTTTRSVSSFDHVEIRDMTHTQPRTLNGNGNSSLTTREGHKFNTETASSNRESWVDDRHRHSLANPLHSDRDGHSSFDSGKRRREFNSESDHVKFTSHATQHSPSSSVKPIIIGRSDMRSQPISNMSTAMLDTVRTLSKHSSSSSSSTATTASDTLIKLSSILSSFPSPPPSPTIPSPPTPSLYQHADSQPSKDTGVPSSTAYLTHTAAVRTKTAMHVSKNFQTEYSVTLTPSLASPSSTTNDVNVTPSRPLDRILPDIQMDKSITHLDVMTQNDRSYSGDVISTINNAIPMNQTDTSHDHDTPQSNVSVIPHIHNNTTTKHNNKIKGTTPVPSPTGITITTLKQINSGTGDGRSTTPRIKAHAKPLSLSTQINGRIDHRHTASRLLKTGPSVTQQSYLDDVAMLGLLLTRDSNLQALKSNPDVVESILLNLIPNLVTTDQHQMGARGHAQSHLTRNQNAKTQMTHQLPSLQKLNLPENLNIIHEWLGPEMRLVTGMEDRHSYQNEATPLNPEAMDIGVSDSKDVGGINGRGNSVASNGGGHSAIQTFLYRNLKGATYPQMMNKNRNHVTLNPNRFDIRDLLASRVTTVTKRSSHADIVTPTTVAPLVDHSDTSTRWTQRPTDSSHISTPGYNSNRQHAIVDTDSHFGKVQLLAMTTKTTSSHPNQLAVTDRPLHSLRSDFRKTMLTSRPRRKQTAPSSLRMQPILLSLGTPKAHPYGILFDTSQQRHQSPSSDMLLPLLGSLEHRQQTRRGALPREVMHPDELKTTHDSSSNTGQLVFDTPSSRDIHSGRNWQGLVESVLKNRGVEFQHRTIQPKHDDIVNPGHAVLLDQRNELNQNVNTRTGETVLSRSQSDLDLNHMTSGLTRTNVGVKSNPKHNSNDNNNSSPSWPNVATTLNQTAPRLESRPVATSPRFRGVVGSNAEARTDFSPQGTYPSPCRFGCVFYREPSPYEVWKNLLYQLLVLRQKHRDGSTVK